MKLLDLWFMLFFRIKSSIKYYQVNKLLFWAIWVGAYYQLTN